MSHWLNNLRDLPDFTPQVIPAGTPTCSCGEFLTLRSERDRGCCEDCHISEVACAS